jgi:pimeloyl-ACP methyl ester carboxylesterase
MFPLLKSHFTVCVMDRRGRGASGDSPVYTLQKEAEDVAAVVDARPGPVFLLGHSYGGVCALEAAFLTNKVAKLLLYEPPLQERINLTLVVRIEKMIQDGERDQAVVTFLQDVVRVPAGEVTVMRTRPAWHSLVDSIASQPRQLRALAAYRFDARRASTMTAPTLLIRGSESANPDLKRAFDGLMAALPNRTEVVLVGQHHNAMDTGRQELAEAITRFLMP